MSCLQSKLAMSHLILFCTVLFIASELQAQFASPVQNPELGSLSGHVITTRGRPIANAQIEVHAIMGSSTDFSATSDSQGWFQFDNLPPGAYQVVTDDGKERTVATADVTASNANPDLTIVVHGPDDTAGLNEGGIDGGTVSAADLMVPKKARKCFEKANKLFQKGDFQGSWKQVNDALQVWPKFAEALTLRGELKIGSNELPQAEDDFTTAINSDPGYEPAYVALAADYNLKKQFDRALKILDRSKAFATPSWQFYVERSRALIGLRSFDRALIEANKASTMCGQELPFLNLIKAEAYLSLKRTDYAVKELRQYLAHQGKGPEADRIRKFLATLRH